MVICVSEFRADTTPRLLYIHTVCFTVNSLDTDQRLARLQATAAAHQNTYVNTCSGSLRIGCYVLLVRHPNNAFEITRKRNPVVYVHNTR